MYADVSDVEVYFGPVPDDQAAKVEKLLAQAEAVVEQEVPNIPGRIADGRTTPALVAQVIAEMVTEVMRNPDGVRQRTETVGPFSRSATYGGSQTAGIVDPDLGVLSITRRQRRLLGVRRGAVTIPVADPALRRPVIDPDDDRYRSDGYVWPRA